MTSRDYTLLAGLLLLCLVPALAGTVRLVELASSPELTAANARFLEAPIPAVVHIVASVLFGLLGAGQLLTALRQRFPGWHRRAGRVVVVSGLAASLSGLWMTLYYPWFGFDGVWLYGLRLLVGVAMTACLLLGVRSVLQRQIARHRAWMTRAWALGMGAGTQVFTHIPWFVLPDLQSETFRALLMALGWGINLVVAEWLIQRDRPSAGGGWQSRPA